MRDNLLLGLGLFLTFGSVPFFYGAYETEYITRVQNVYYYDPAIPFELVVFGCFFLISGLALLWAWFTGRKQYIDFSSSTWTVSGDLTYSGELKP